MKPVGALFVLFILTLPAAFAATLTVYPDGSGARTSWSQQGCSGTGNHWNCVEETSVNTADYLFATGTGKETLTFGNTGLSSESINSVTLHYYLMRHNSASNACIGAMTRSGGTDYLSGTQLCGTANWTLVSHVYATNPATGSAWTVGGVDALEAGMYGLNPSGGGRVAQVYAVVDYVPAAVCGNNVTEGSEVCDGSSLNNQTCGSFGYSGGTLACKSDCSGYETAYCTNQTCGNNVKEGTEVCDGTALGGQTCVSQGFSGGSLACNGACTAFVTSACYTNSCSDSDGGFVVSTQGTASGNFVGSGYSLTDFCADSVFLVEYYCGGTVAYSLNMSCAGNATTSCVNGACV